MGATTLPFVIPSEAEGPAVLLVQHQLLTKAPPSPLSSRAKPRDLRFSGTFPGNVSTERRMPFSSSLQLKSMIRKFTFGDDLSIEQMNIAVGMAGKARVVRHHADRRSFTV
jgi:hypothetical protein